MLTIDGSQGEGGGQILRTSLAMSMITGRPIRLINIRKGRERQGLLAQHLAGVRAAERIAGARVEGARLGSRELVFEPTAITPGEYTFAVGTAGSASLVLQAVLPALLVAKGPSLLHLEGGTHNSMSPPFDFLARVFAPVLARMGAALELELERPGFYPAGGGRFTAQITPPEQWRPLELTERGAIVRRRARALVSRLPRHVGERELAVVRARAGLGDDDELAVEELVGTAGPGNVLMLEVEHEHGRELITAFGEKGTRAETVAESACAELAAYLEHGAPVGEHLADQLLIPMVLAGGGRFTSGPLSLHTRTNLDVLREFFELDVERQVEGAQVTISLRRSGPSANPQ